LDDDDWYSNGWPVATRSRVPTDPEAFEHHHGDVGEMEPLGTDLTLCSLICTRRGLVDWGRQPRPKFAPIGANDSRPLSANIRLNPSPSRYKRK
jgi:hypothetical protein